MVKRIQVEIKVYHGVLAFYSRQYSRIRYSDYHFLDKVTLNIFVFVPDSVKAFTDKLFFLKIGFDISDSNAVYSQRKAILLNKQKIAVLLYVYQLSFHIEAQVFDLPIRIIS